MCSHIFLFPHHNTLPWHMLACIRVEGQLEKRRICHHAECWPTVMWVNIETVTLVMGILWLHFQTDLSVIFQVFLHKKQFPSDKTADIALKAEKKLTLVPIIFVLVRIWGTIRFILYSYADIGVHNLWWDRGLLYLQVGFLVENLTYCKSSINSPPLSQNFISPPL